MDYKLLLKEIRNKKFEKIYFLHGEEPYFIDVLTKAIQELSAKVEKLEDENAKLKSENGSLESKVASIEAQQQALAKDLEEIKRLLGAEAKK